MHPIDIIASLRLLADPERIAFAARVFPTRLEVIGVTNPDLRIILREVKAEVKKETARSVINLAQDLLMTGIYEAHWLAYELIGSRRAYQQALTGGDAGAMNCSLDNWVLTDVYAANVLGYAWRNDLLGDDWFDARQRSPDVWQRRLPLASVASGLNTPANGGYGDTDRTLKHCRLALSDRHPMIVKGMSWALRTLIRWDAGAVAEFIREHENQLSRQVVREVNRKLATGKKS